MSLIDGDTLMARSAAAAMAPAQRFYCGSCGHNAPDERCADPVTPPRYAKEYAAITRATHAATAALTAAAMAGYPAAFLVDWSDLEAIESFIAQRLRRHYPATTPANFDGGDTGDAGQH